LKRFNAYEILEMAREIESKGINYYQAHAENTDNETLEKLFLRLSEEEKQHLQKLEEIEENISKISNQQDYQYLDNPQVESYLKTLVEFSVFPNQIKKEDISKNDTIDEILLVAIMAEKESILFYKELLDFNNDISAEVIKTLVEEEKQHLQDLSDIINQYST
jgi:rubrerythrin